MPKVVEKLPEPDKIAAVRETPTALFADIQQDEQRKVWYEKLVLEERSTAVAAGPIYEDTAKLALTLETEAECQQKWIAGPKPVEFSDEAWNGTVAIPVTESELAAALEYRRLNLTKNFKFADRKVMFEDDDGNRVRCLRNLDNRPFDMRHCRSLMQTIAKWQWVGPLTVPGETVNGSTIVLSRTAKVQTGQHSLVALWLFAQAYKKDPDEYYDPIEKRTILIDPRWKEAIASGRIKGPCIETILVKGISENPEIVMTQDNIKPRTLEDVLYTSPLFRKLTPTSRREHSKILSGAAERVWDRVGTHGYKTHAEMLGFVDRHRTLMKCAEHVFTANQPNETKSNPMGSIRIRPSTAAALCYLMAHSDTSEDAANRYRNMFPPSERDLNRNRFDAAKTFWSMLVDSSDYIPDTDNEQVVYKSFKLVRYALARLLDSSSDSQDNFGMGGREEEKLCILQGAWEIFLEGRAFTNMDLADGGKMCLNYTDANENGKPLAEGQLRLIDFSDFGGIDLPGEDEGQVTGEPPVTEAELEKAKEAARLETIKKAAEAKKLESEKKKKKPAQAASGKPPLKGGV